MDGHQNVGLCPKCRKVVKVIPDLTQAELEIALDFAKGRTTEQIAEKRFVSPKTIETHRAEIFRKLNICRGTPSAKASKLTRWAVRQGLIKP